jgi:GT2 family glycosyltransferase
MRTNLFFWTGKCAWIHLIEEIMYKMSVLFPIHDHSEAQRLLTISAFRALAVALRDDLGEVVLVDDGSPHPGAVEIIQKEALIPILTRRHSIRQGLVSSLNVAARIARGEILTYCHTDCLVQCDALRKILGVLTARCNVGMTVSELYFADGELQQVGGWIGPRFKLCWSKHRSETPQQIHWGDFWSVRREIYLADKGLPEFYNPGYWECIELAARVRKLGYTTVTCPGSKVTHLKSQTFHSCFDTQERERLFERNRKIFAKRWECWEERFVEEVPEPLDQYDWR